MKIDLTGKIALVSGSTAGIGFATAKGLAGAGASVILNGRSDATVDKALHALRAAVAGADVTGFVGDLVDPEVCARLVAAHPRVDVLQPVIDEIGKLLDKAPTLKVSIDGHTDNVGDEKHNQQLSKKRAEAVAAALIAKGVDKSRVRAEGFGASKPIADNASEEGRGKNRRVELVRVAA